MNGDQRTPRTGKGRKQRFQASARQVFVVFMANALFYQFDYVIIFIEKKVYRLVAVTMGKRKMVTNRTYKSLKAAKCAFLALHRNRLLGFTKEKDDKPDWSPPYPPCAEWLEDKLAVIAESRDRGPLLPIKNEQTNEKTIPCNICL